MSDIKIVKTWDEFSPVVYDDGQAISTRVLEKQYRAMEQRIKELEGDREFFRERDQDQCREIARQRGRIEELEASEALLNKLESYGVENWMPYEDAVKEWEEEGYSF